MKIKPGLREAVDLLYKEAPAATTESYTRLLLDCIRNRDAHQAKRLQAHMEYQMYSPTTTFFHNRLLHLYVQSGQLSDAVNLFDKITKRDIFSYNVMLSGYSNAGSVEDLREFFGSMPFRDSVSYNIVIAGLGSNGCERKALEFFVKMQREGVVPTEYTYVSVLKLCTKLMYLESGKQILGKIFVSGLWNKGNVFVLNALCDFYAKCGKIDMAQWLFDKIVNKNLVSWNLMISGYLRNGKPEKCVKMFDEMKVLGLKLDQVTISNVIGAFFKIGCVDEACRAFREIKVKDKVCWTAMIVGYGQIGLEENALMLFREMLLENVSPDNFTMSSVISSCAKLAFLGEGQAMHGKTMHMGVDGDLLVSSALIDMYSKCGEITDAWVVFNRMPVKSVVSWNSMIVGYAQNGRDLEALALYEKMLRLEIKPENVTFVGVLSACIHAGLADKGGRYFQSIKEIHGMTPTLDHYVCMVTLLGRSGNIDKAIDLIRGMPHDPNYMIWSTLLSVCRKNADIRHAEMAAENLFKLDPLNAEPYIILSNMYASYGRWKDVASMRYLMKNKQVKKFTAYSWIELDGKVYKFVSEDRSHPESELIYLELDTLIRKLQEAGFAPNKSLVLHNVGEDEKLESICYHSEKLALAFGLIRKPSAVSPIRIIKNIRICGDCHLFMKFVSKILRLHIILRDANRFHHFVGGQCSCKDLW
ncbi:putative pentatricopeptide repeat-containing protein [Forsythia ovata]|uniref:Pentatricopeptide repeat-containing protein n=1 Tax=Forsythia ovata TaxID=205694 RepID=A0ABD1SJW0_9LAMI